MNIEEYFEYISRRKNIDDEDTWPYILNPEVYENYRNLSLLSSLRKIEVLNTYKPASIEKINHEYDLFTVIPFRSRYLHLEKTIESLLNSHKGENFSLGILVVENSEISIASSITSKFENVYYRWLDSGRKLFNKCICHNIGGGVTKSKFLHFHDCDLIVPPEFYKELYNKLTLGCVIQGFAQRRVNYINKSNSIKFFEGKSLEKIINSSKNYITGIKGASGGSIAISRSLFNQVGGFDSQLFWEFGPEDCFFWTKVEKIQPIVGLNNPLVELYHIWHPLNYGSNPFEVFDNKVYEIFKNMDSHDEYRETARLVYEEINDYLIKC
jgi:hypothetical protein